MSHIILGNYASLGCPYDQGHSSNGVIKMGITRTMTFAQPNWPTDYPADSNVGNDKVTGTAADNTIDGGFGNDTLLGKGGSDTLNGGWGSDHIDGGTGDDFITGGRGQDFLTGGSGSDTFIYDSGDSSVIKPDHITDFDPTQDFLDLKGVDADIGTPGDQDFNFIGENVAFTGTAGDLLLDTVFGQLQGDLDGNGTADFVIQFDTGLPDVAANVVAFDFLPGAEIDPMAAIGTLEHVTL